MIREPLKCEAMNRGETMCNYHPEDTNGSWDYDSMPDIDEYWDKYGDLDQYDKDYDEWYESQWED